MGFFIKRKTLDVLPVLDVENENTIENELYETFFSLRAAYRAANNVPGLVTYAGERLLPRLLPYLMSQNLEGVLGFIMGDPVIGPVLHRVATTIKKNL